MALITISELKAVLGIGDIYADSVVQEVADSAENILLSLLTKNQWGVVAQEVTNNVGTLTTDRPHDLYVGQTVVVSGCSAHYNGSKTITKVGPYYISYAVTHANEPKHGVVPVGTIAAAQHVDYAEIPEVHEACLAIACDIWITRTGTLGQQGVDFQSPAPYRLGRSLFTRVSGLLGKWMDTRGMVG